MKKLVFIIIGIVLVFIGYKSNDILNKPQNVENIQRERIMKVDLMGEIESISESEIILKIIEFNKSDLQTEYTGEKKTIVMNSDIKIFKNSMSGNGMNQDEINISDLKAGDVVCLNYKEDKSTIDKIILNEIRNNKTSNVN